MEKKKKIDNTSKIDVDDNNFGLDLHNFGLDLHCNRRTAGIFCLRMDKKIYNTGETDVDDSICSTLYCLYGVHNDEKNGCGMENEVPVLVRVLDCVSSLVGNSLLLVHKQTTYINCDDVLPLIVDGIHDTDGDDDYESFHPIRTSNYLDCDYFDCDNDRIVSPQKQVQVQVQERISNNNHNNINCDDANSNYLTPYVIYGVDTGRNNGCGVNKELPIRVLVLDCVQVCDDTLRMLVNSTYSTADDVDYESFYITLKSTYHDRDDAQELAFDDVITDHHANNSDYDLRLIHDTVRSNNDLVVTDDDDHNDVIVSHRASDSDRLEYALYFAYDEVRTTTEEVTIYGTTTTTCTTIVDEFTTSTTDEEEEDQSIIEYHTTCATTCATTTCATPSLSFIDVPKKKNDRTNYNNINTIRNNNINVGDVTTCDGGISHNGVDTIPDTDRDLVNSGVVFVLRLLFYNLQRLDLYDNEHTYDIRVFNNNNTQCTGHLCNNNGTNNDTPDCISGVENDRSGTIKYGNNNISFIDIYGVSVVNIAYDSVTLETNSTSCERGCVRLSSKLASMPPFSSNIVRLSSDRFHLSSDCGIVRLEYIPIALVARLEAICPL